MDMIKLKRERRNELYKLLTEAFNISELGAFAFNLYYTNERFEGDKLKFAQELIKYFERRLEMPMLLDALLEKRPNLAERIKPLAKKFEVTRTDNNEFKHLVFTEISLECHFWKNEYLDLDQRGFQKTEGDFIDIWENMLSTAEHEYSQEEWNKYFDLFNVSLQRVIDRLEMIESLYLYNNNLYDNNFSQSFRNQIIRTKGQLRLERKAYTRDLHILKAIFDSRGNSYDIHGMFRGRFIGVLRALTKLAREAERLRDKVQSNRSSE